MQFFIKSILYLSALVHVIENLRVNDILANFTVVQRYPVVRLLVDNILNHRYLINIHIYALLLNFLYYNTQSK